ncbi:DNA mismatch repair protein MSH6-1, putative [Perkinsus marinus ATCC 50983]|uniref:DNA mismatch repair protein MSH6-1, putative n=1 Tax=Perkinsus marinus (strain ATCC 50983 / TXsc) TaxID=423536 RepID=C5KLM3_PERM5|nr:DNA mismatch repair protein MSH6-1, putative [Perkinsus marinus ATCC 50983]EER14617.1 DNA mismatch repair protein MSH6-1, putative [Perkinsus marinus ATCC 50983]|eukprot:XP_002782821.1 DNA mismatch repair protein MSH6-1, putative [Perkinsus marinus ATCC 50983]
MLYEAVTSFATWEKLDTSNAGSSGLVLDANALEQLEVLRNTDGKLEGSLLNQLDHTVTPFGKRLLRQWVCCPLRAKTDIDRRLDVVDWLLEKTELVADLRSRMRKLPDIERRQNRVFALGLQLERKAVLYGEVESSRIAQFMELLAALKEADRCLAMVREGDGALPALLDELIPMEELGYVDGILEELGSRVQGSESDGYSAAPGCCPAYDEARSKIASIKSDLQEELKIVCHEHLKGCKLQEAKFVSVKYRYEIEVPERCAPRDLEAHGLEVSSTRKGFVRLLTQEIRNMTEELDATEERMKDCLYPFMAQLFKDFHKHTIRLQDMVQRLATLDCLLSLSEASRPGAGSMCRPQILDPTEFTAPVFDLVEGRHPVIIVTIMEFVPNSVEMGINGSPTTLLVTGPNMGGKSTVLRLGATAVIIAQLGCRVPASSFKLTPVDRIFTRIGARDSILENKSTFLIELEETGAVLQHATKHSLAVIDELGRGTSTFDGAAIAHAVLERISESIGCRTLFATHYHQLAEDESLHNTALYHQACLVNPATREVTFLYKFTKGRCPQSHAMHVAKIAGLPEVIVEAAREMSTVFHSAVEYPDVPYDDEALGEFYDSVKHVAAH